MLATTATANDRVVADVTEQLATTDPSHRSALRTYRGPLARASLRLEVVELGRPAERLAWLVEHLPAMDGSGIVYTLTKRDADQVAEFLNANGDPGARLQRRPGQRGAGGDRAAAARATRSRRWWRRARSGWATTSPTWGSSCTTRRPGSVVAYYQQVGRAGRGVEHADVVLLRGQEDRRIQDFFIEQSFPSRERVQAVLAELEAAGAAGAHDARADGGRQPRHGRAWRRC